jgi:anti-anti-sigma factor
MTGEVADEGVRTVRLLWDAYVRGGVEGVLATIDDQTEWVPQSGDGRVLRGRAEVARHFAELDRRGTTVQAEPYAFERHGSAVLVAAWLRIADADGLRDSQLHYLFELRDGRIARASAHPDRAAALAAAGAGPDVQAHAASVVAVLPAPVAAEPPGTLAIRRREPGEGRPVRLELEGELDVATVPQLAQALAREGVPGARVLVDLDALTFMDSSGLAALARAADAARREDWELALTRGGGQVRRALALSGLDSVLPFAGR